MGELGVWFVWMIRERSWSFFMNNVIGQCFSCDKCLRDSPESMNLNVTTGMEMHCPHSFRLMSSELVKQIYTPTGQQIL